MTERFRHACDETQATPDSGSLPIVERIEARQLKECEMPPRYVAPSVAEKAFSCPTCGALADQTWYEIYADETREGQPPFLADDAFIKHLNELKQNHEIDADQIDEWISEAKKIVSADFD